MHNATMLALVVSAASTSFADVIHVDASAAAGGDGTSWTSAFRSLSDALATAGAGDEVWIAEGTYSIPASAGRSATFLVRAGVTVRGGFAGNEALASDREADAELFPVVLTGAVNAATNVMRIDYGTSTAAVTLDRLTIRDGLADFPGSYVGGRGGGIYTRLEGDLTLTDVIVRDCATTFADGGGIFAEPGDAEATVTLERVQLIDNTAVRYGGGAMIEGSLVAIDSVITGNDAEYAGGIYVIESSLIEVRGCTFEGNTASVSFGGLGGQTNEAGSMLITDSLFVGNVAMTDAAGFALGGWNDVVMRNCKAIGNHAERFYGAGYVILSASSSVPDAAPNGVIENSAFLNNTFAQRTLGIGGSLARPDAEFRMSNVTVAGNRASVYQNGIYQFGGRLTIHNSIIHGNTREIGEPAQRISVLRTETRYPLVIENSLIEYWLIRSGNSQDEIPASNVADINPFFADLNGLDGIPGTADDSAALSPGSFAIDAGDSNALSASVLLDIEGDPRFADDPGVTDRGVPSALGAVVDIGAAEFQGATCRADTNGDGLATPADFNAWILAFNTQAPACDQNGDGLCDPSDFNAWILNYNAGCP